jgi:RHS repeat-associated protein
LGGVIRFAYDTEEDLVGVTNELGEEYRFERDLAGRVTKERGFDGRTLEFWYDKTGRCNEIVNGQKKRTKIERDALGRVVRQVVPRKPVFGDPIPKGEGYEYGYDAMGQLVRAKNEAHEVTFTRDALGRVVEERANGHVVESRYDGSGNRTGRRTSLGHEAAYDFDGNGALLGVTFGLDARWMDFSVESIVAGGEVRAPWQAKFRRDALGSEAERHLPGGVVSRWDRDRAGRPAVHRVWRNDVSVMATGYRWQSMEQLAALIDTQRGPTWFEHDARSYLVAAVRPDGMVEHRSPDAAGNVYRSPERRDRTYGKGGRLEEAGGVRYVHDEDGQLVERVLPDGRSWKYAWDHAGQLEAVTRPDGQEVRFTYDALQRRVTKTFAGKMTLYVWDGDAIVHELVEGAEPVTWVFEPGMFAPLAKVEGEKRYGIVTDHLGTPKVLLDEAGELVWKAELDVYGAARADVMRTGCPWRWPGQYEDEETGLYYNRFRYYEPKGGRYISQDPIGLLGGIDGYGYVKDPLKLLDPLGLTECAWSSKRIKQAAEAIDSGETAIFVKTRAEAEELFLGKFVGGDKLENWFRNTTGVSAMETKLLFGEKANTYHWDDALDAFGQLAGHSSGHPDSRFRHLQIHRRKGPVMRIFFGDPLW